jgi:formate hydrogenlyase subunit 4
VDELDMNSVIQQAFIAGGLQLLVALMLAPMVNTLLKKMKAFLQGRKGPPLLQGHYDLLKYFHKETVLPEQASWIFLAAPLVGFSALCTAVIMVPLFFLNSQMQMTGGIIAVIALFALSRFFLVIAAIAPNNSFCGMAGGRELLLSSLIEPALLLALLVVGTLVGSTNLETIMAEISRNGAVEYTPSYLLAILSLFIVSIAEMGRVPFDNPETHYELNMIHEGMLLEYSGKPLGLLFWTAWLKQLLMLTITANLILPLGLSADFTGISMLSGLGIYLAKLVGVCLFVALIETGVAKMRLFRVTDYLGASFVIALLALILSIHQTLKGF